MFKQVRLSAGVVLTVILIGLTACSGGTSSPRPSDQMAGPDSGAATSDRNQYPFGLACGWEVASNIDTMNIFYPDESAKYWVALVPILPGARLRIDGRYPDARYFSFNVYDPLLRPSDAIADYQISPNGSGVNPFAVENAPYGSAYTAYVAFTAKPDAPAQNTIYVGDFSVASQSAPQPLMTAVIYRTYVPAKGLDFDGGVGLPVLTLETADGETELLPTADCVEPLLPTLGNTLPELGLNETLIGIDMYDEPLLLASGLVPLANADAETHVFRGLPEFYLTFLAELLNLPTLADTVDSSFPDTGGGGFLSNIHNSYTYNIYFRNKGNVILFRIKAPTYRTEPGVPFGSEQLRYWSVCQNDVPTQRYVACTRDSQAYLDDQGYATIIISDAADRPANAVSGNAVNWMPWGPYVDAGVVYRHMLPAPDFAETIHNIPRGTPVEEVMGEYAPQTAYCTQDIVESAGTKAADIFAACQRYTEANFGKTGTISGF